MSGAETAWRPVVRCRNGPPPNCPSKPYDYDSAGLMNGVINVIMNLY